MHDTHARALTGVAALVVVWIVVYWLWQPGPERVLAVPAGPPPSLTPPSQATTASEGNARIIDPLLESRANPAAIPTTNPVGSRTTASAAATPPATDPAASAAASPVGVIPPRFNERTIRGGETLQSIARDAYGSSALWTVIARANPLLDPNKLRAGQTIRVPVDPDNVQGLASGDGDPAAASSPAAATIEYRVRRGDALSKIAQKFYGSARYTDFLFEANRDRLRSKASIRVGQTLRIPPKPASP